MIVAHPALINFGMILVLIACGGTKTEKVSRAPNSATATAGLSQNLLDLDPRTLSDSDLQLFVAQLVSRDQADAQELVILQAMNRDLCDRAQRRRTECSASVHIIADGSEKILGCQGSFSDNTSIINKFEVRSSAPGTFVLVANKTYATKAFGSGNTPIEFVATGDKTARAPRFMDLTSFRVASADSSPMPAIASMGFELVVNENVIFKNEDLVAGEGGTDKYYRINPENLLNLQKSEACTVDVSEIQVIREKVMAAVGGQPQPAAPTPEQPVTTPTQ